MKQIILQNYIRDKNILKKWEITDEQFYEISQKNCFYCGAKPSMKRISPNNTGDFIYNGIDKINSKKGYIINNIVPCCKRCNTAKNDMTKDEFFNWVKTIYAFAEQWGKC